MPKNIKKISIEKISKYILLNISIFIPEQRFKNIIKYNKNLQKKLDISLYTYQKLFLKNKILIDYKDVSFVKEKKFKLPSYWFKNREILPSTKFQITKFIEFLNKEFNNFTKKNDRKILEKIIKEFLKEKELYKLETIKILEKQIKFISLEDKINWINDKNVVELNLYSSDLEKESIFYNYIESKVIVPSGLFPNLKSLKMGFNCIVPVSLISQLEKLYIKVIPEEILLFKNDINKNEIHLDNLKILKIIRDFSYNDDGYRDEESFTDKDQMKDATYYQRRNYEREENEEYEEEDEEEEKDEEEKDDNEEEESDSKSEKNKNKNKDKNKKGKLITLKKENKIKFICNKLEELRIIIRKIDDYSYLSNNFYFDFIYDALYNIKHSLNYSYQLFKKIILNHNYIESLKYFKFGLIMDDGDQYTYISYFKMKKFKNELKRFTFKIYGEGQNSRTDCFKEIYEENYQNFFGIKDIDDIDINKLNVLKLKDRESKYRILDKNKIFNLLHINENNYSIQEICLDIKAFEDNLIEKIYNFKTLEKIVIINCIKDKKIFMKFIKDLSKLILLKLIFIKFKGNLTSKDKKLIKDLLPKITIEKSSINTKIDIFNIKKYEGGEYLSEFNF